MKTQTSLVAERVRLQQWTEQIRDCKNRPNEMSIESWCHQQGITKANYYYRLKRIREACLGAAGSNATAFIELPEPAKEPAVCNDSEETAAVVRVKQGITVEIRSCASEAFIKNLMGALAYAE